MQKINCAGYADEILERVKNSPFEKKQLLIFTAGDDPASAAYMRGKMRDCERCGIPCEQIRVSSQGELLLGIRMANFDKGVGGIIVQLPLPDGFNEAEAVSAVTISKDVDGFRDESWYLPCTPEGILYILEKEVGDIAGKTVLLIGKGKLIGKPLIELLLRKGCTLTIAHSRTKDLGGLLEEYHDIVITGVGKAGLVDLKRVETGIVIDAGIARDENGKLCGDCYNFDPMANLGMRVTTVPGGVGLMTRAMLMKHMA